MSREKTCTLCGGVGHDSNVCPNVNAPAPSAVASPHETRTDAQEASVAGHPARNPTNAELRLDHLATLKPNWDSYGADAPWPEAIREARKLAHLFALPAIIVPRSCGGIQLEWHAQGYDVEIEISQIGEVEDVFVDNRPHEQLRASAGHSAQPVPAVASPAPTPPTDVPTRLYWATDPSYPCPTCGHVPAAVSPVPSDAPPPTPTESRDDG